MGYPDIESARSHQAALMRVLDGYDGAGPSARTLRRVIELCRGLAEAIDDEYCREKVHAVEEYAAELLSRSEHRSRGAVPGVDFLRQQIRSALELLQSRLYSLERVRRFGQQSFSRAPARI